MLLKIIVYNAAVFLAIILAIVIDNISSQKINKQNKEKKLSLEEQLKKNKNDLDEIDEMLGDK